MPRCPKCHGAMTRRERKSDQHAFYGCLKYPNCTGTREIAPSHHRFDWTYADSDTPDPDPFNGDDDGYEIFHSDW